MKKCTHCKQKLSSNKFYKDKYKKDGLTVQCKDCDKKYREQNKNRIKDYSRQYRKENKKKIKQYRDKLENKKRLAEWGKQYYAKPENKKRRFDYRRRPENKKRINKLNKSRLLTDVQYKLSRRLRSRLCDAIKNHAKRGSAVRDLGCTISELKLYLESQFKEGMTWENWSYQGWHIDHKIPLSSFNLEDRNQLLKAVYYLNLQPLWAKDNLSKGYKILQHV